MQTTMSVERLARMSPMLQVDISGHATTPTILGVASVNSSLVIATLTLGRVSQGLYSISWTAGKLPPATLRPWGFANGRFVDVTQGMNQLFITVNTRASSQTDSFVASIFCYGEGVFS
jgi:hypothetical protein